MTMMGIDQNTITNNTYGVYVNELGYSGYSGESGWSGFSGASGPTGASGFSGWSGWSGPSGYSGWSGWSGPSGYSGWSGWSGWSGPAGAAGGAPVWDSAEATAWSVAATAAWTNLLQITRDITKATLIDAHGGYQCRYGSTAGDYAVRILIDETEIVGASRTQLSIESAYNEVNAGMVLYSVASRPQAFTVTLQYSTAAAMSMSNRNLNVIWMGL